MDKFIIILCTVPDDGTCDNIAGELVKEKLAVCVNIIPAVQSIYYWENEICNDSEKLLIIKTFDRKTEDVFNFIKEKHSYDVPERISIGILKSGDDYYKWALDYLS